MSDLDDFKVAVQNAQEPDPYARIWTVAVVIQHDNGTLDLDPGDAPFRDLTRIPYVPGVGGGRLALKEGTQINLAFRGGPDGAFCFGPEPDPDADKAVTWKGARVDCGFFAVIPAGPGAYKLSPSVAADPTAVQITGTIAEGSDELFIRGPQ